MKRIGVICARMGSKGVTGKNTRLLAGKPLVVHTIEQAISSKAFDTVSVTTDDPEILTIAGKMRVDCLVHRPVELAQDTSPKIPAIRHCVSETEEQLSIQYDTIVDLDVTSPLRSLDDIWGAIDLLEKQKLDNVVSGMPSRRSPYFNLVELDDVGNVQLSKPIGSTVLRRQDAPKCYDLNASVFVWSRQALFSENNTVFGKRTRLFEMPEERSLDIDSELDFQVVEYLMVNRAQDNGRY